MANMSPPVPKPMMTELNDRSREIFRMIVDAYVETGEPVGSRTLARRGRLDLSPASIRNVMADLEEASAMLSGLSRCASLVIAPKTERPLKHIEFVPLAAGRALVVMVTEDGLVENRLIEVSLGTPPSSLQAGGSYLNSRLRGRTVDDA